MQSDLLDKIMFQKKIPIIGKGTADEIVNKFKKLINNNYEIIEITLRSEEALETAIKIKKEFSNIIIGIGSIKTLTMLREASKYNFNFYVSPGTSSEILNYSNLNNLNFIPGVATPSDIMIAIEYKKTILKFFHAERNGGTSALKFLNEIFENIKFIPTGGVNTNNYQSYLDLPNVISVGSTSF